MQITLLGTRNTGKQLMFWEWQEKGTGRLEIARS